MRGTVELLANIFTSKFMPHGHCYLWTPGILWGHAISNAIIAFAYFSIPVALIYFIRRRNDLVFSWMFVLFAIFILTCGVGHLVDIWNIWNGAYWLSTIVRVITAIASIGTAVALWPLIPIALKIPSTRLLEEEVLERQKAVKELSQIRDNLELRVQERTYELEEFNHVAVEREERMIVLKRKINELCGELGRQPEYDLSFLTEPGNTVKI
jgi:hypothetical protein